MNESPTGRKPSEPEMQHLVPRTGRWPACPGQTQHPRPNFVDLDFSELERRVMAMTGIEDVLRRAAEHAVGEAVRTAVQTQIDEEGCGAVFAAAKDWT